MPGMNGHELAQWVAMNRPKTQTALMTGYDATCQECPFSPRCSILAKPFLPKDLVSFVARGRPIESIYTLSKPPALRYIAV